MRRLESLESLIAVGIENWKLKIWKPSMFWPTNFWIKTALSELILVSSAKELYEKIYIERGYVSKLNRIIKSTRNKNLLQIKPSLNNNNLQITTVSELQSSSNCNRQIFRIIIKLMKLTTTDPFLRFHLTNNNYGSLLTTTGIVLPNELAFMEKMLRYWLFEIIYKITLR